MTFTTTRAEQSRTHIAILDGLGLKGDETSFEAAKKIAHAEVVSGVILEDGDPPVWHILAASDAAMEYIYEQANSEIAEFDIPSLTEALNGSRRLAVLVARLCGAVPHEMTPNQKGMSAIWRNAVSAPNVEFPPNLFAEFLKDTEFE